MNILVSACLLGVNCKYSGGNSKNENVMSLMRYHNLIPVCSEQLGGLATPRSRAEIKGGTGADVLSGSAQVISREGVDITEAFMRGAEEVIKLAGLYGCTAAVLKSKSPSCGSTSVYDGSFSDVLIPGRGVCGQKLKDAGLQIFDENTCIELIR